MAEAALEQEPKKPGRKSGYLDETRFKRAYFVNSAFQRMPEAAKKEANEAWQKCHEYGKSEAQLHFLLEFVASNSGKAAALQSLVNGALHAWTIYSK